MDVDWGVLLSLIVFWFIRIDKTANDRHTLLVQEVSHFSPYSAQVLHIPPGKLRAGLVRLHILVYGGIVLNDCVRLSTDNVSLISLVDETPV